MPARWPQDCNAHVRNHASYHPNQRLPRNDRPICRSRSTPFRTRERPCPLLLAGTRIARPWRRAPATARVRPSRSTCAGIPQTGPHVLAAAELFPVRHAHDRISDASRPIRATASRFGEGCHAVRPRPEVMIVVLEQQAKELPEVPMERAIEGVTACKRCSRVSPPTDAAVPFSTAFGIDDLDEIGAGSGRGIQCHRHSHRVCLCRA